MILASISIGAVFSERGIIQQAKESKKQHEDAVKKEEENLNELLGEYKNNMDGTGGSGTEGGDVTTPTPTPTPEVPKGPNGNQLVTSITDTDHNTIEAEDSKGNKIVVPNGFKFSEDSGTTVQDGIVIEDSSGNQFVWIPVSNTNHDGTGKIKKNNGTEVEITLGRYTFDKTTGVETKAQYASEWSTPVEISAESKYCKENPNEPKDLEGFVDSVSENHGFLFGRFEASKGSGSSFGLGNNDSYFKPLSVGGNAVWNKIRMGDAKTVARQMYYNNTWVESDLVNSYMWDTVIVYIQEMGHINYANQTGLNSSIANTGSGDVMCNIHDMGSNVYEWTTEKSSAYDTGYYIIRGGNFYNSSISSSNYYNGGTSYTAYRGVWAAASETKNNVGFRVGVWLK